MESYKYFKSSKAYKDTDKHPPKPHDALFQRRQMKKNNFPLSKIRRHLEPGPIVLVSSFWEGRTNIMTMGWHMMLEFTPALIACCISEADHSFEMVRQSRECVINIPTVDLIHKVIDIGNVTGDHMDKFKAFGLNPVPANQVKAPLIKECYANFECQLKDDRLVEEYGLFIWEVVKAHVADIKNLQTVHYRGDGEFMVAGPSLDLHKEVSGKNM